MRTVHEERGTSEVPDDVVHELCYLQGQRACLASERRNCWWLKGRQMDDWLRGYDDAVPTHVSRRQKTRC